MKREDVKLGETYTYNGGENYRWRGKKFTPRETGNVYDWIGEIEGFVPAAAYSASLDPIEPDYSDGDLVSLTKDKDVITGTATLHDGQNGPVVHGKNIRGLLRDGWDLKVIEKARPKLPTEDGVYLSERGVPYELSNGKWGYGHSDRTEEYMLAAGRLVRLVPQEDS